MLANQILVSDLPGLQVNHLELLKLFQFEIKNFFSECDLDSNLKAKDNTPKDTIAH